MADKDGAFDLVVVGAGINGAGIARDAAVRGLSVAVLDKADLGSGTSAASSRLIHGGLRYLEYGEFPLVFESLHERRFLRKIAPHLVQPLRITIPVYRGAKRGPWLIRLGMLAYDLLSIGKSMPRHDMLGRDELLEAAPGLEPAGLRAGASYYDAQVPFAERLVLENLLAAEAAGAKILLRHAVTRLERRDGRIQAIAWRRSDTGEQGTLRTRFVVNAAGPWVDDVLATADTPSEKLIGGTKGSHIVVSPFPDAPSDAFYVEAAADGRPIFIIPWNGLFLIGTTDIRFEQSPDTVAASAGEVDYLLRETNRVFPDAGLDRCAIHYTTAGVRPLPRRGKGPESAITRKHIIHRNRDLAGNLLSIIGGKLTTYRSLAEQCVDEVGQRLGRELDGCRTAATPLPGGHSTAEAMAALRRCQMLSADGVGRILSIYGSRATLIAELALREPALGRTLDTPNRLLAAEVVHAFRNEFAQSLADIVFRRTMVGFDADQGRPAYEEIAAVAATERHWDTQHKTEELRNLVAVADRFRAIPEDP